MTRRAPPTVKMNYSVPVVLLVGATPEFVARCKEVAAALKAVVKTSDVAAAPTMAARWRPEILLVSDAVHAFDPDEWSVLARDVRAVLIPLTSEALPDAALSTVIFEGIAKATELRND